MIRVVLPHHLRTLAKVGDEVHVDLNGSPTVKAILDELETKFPMLRGTIREHNTLMRRPLVRFSACAQDISHEPPDAPIPDAIVKGTEPCYIMGAVGGSLRGTNIESVRTLGLPHKTEAEPNFPFVVVSPQCAAGEIWTDVDALVALMDHVEADYRIDPDRIYLTGHSMGGRGALYLAY